MKKFKYLYILLTVLAVAACKEQFSPPETNIDLRYLVVEGLINTGGTDSTIIKLSRTTKLTSGVTLQPEAGALVTIQSSDNTVNRNLTAGKAGTYFSVPFALDATKKYRLRIRTSGGREYVSDYVDTKISPAIDEVRYEVRRDGIAGVQVYASTHDAASKSIYYKWDYVETYEYTSNNMSSYKIENNAFAIRDLGTLDNIYICWRNIISNNIILASTAKLSSDVVKDAPIQKIPRADERMDRKYSILVSQQVLTKEAFDFWEIMKKNTEQVGSVFDSQPSQLQGNVHAVNAADEVVIGFISAGTVSKKRLFINSRDIPTDFLPTSPRPCLVDTIYPQDYQSRFFRGGAIPIDGLTRDPSPDPYAYTTTSPSCIDCRLRGTNVKPSFWQ